MTDHKFTDDDVIKALECSVEHNERKNASCDGCPLEKVFPYCNRECSEDTLDVMCLALINRQKAEIERLNAVHADMTESLRLAAEANKDMQAEIEKLKGSRNRWKQIATDFDKASRETEKEIERLTTLAELGNMRANDYREMRNKLKKANAEIESLKKIGDDKTSEILRHATAIGELHKQLETAKAEAIKEFAERLKANMSNIARMEYGGHIYFCVGYDLIDTLVKEMTEVDNG